MIAIITDRKFHIIYFRLFFLTLIHSIAAGKLNLKYFVEDFRLKIVFYHVHKQENYGKCYRKCHDINLYNFELVEDPRITQKILSAL